MLLPVLTWQSTINKIMEDGPGDKNGTAQGPTNWASHDLRLKYRDEAGRTRAWKRSLAAQKEAKRKEVSWRDDVAKAANAPKANAEAKTAHLLGLPTEI